MRCCTGSVYIRSSTGVTRTYRYDMLCNICAVQIQIQPQETCAAVVDHTDHTGQEYIYITKVGIAGSAFGCLACSSVPSRACFLSHLVLLLAHLPVFPPLNLVCSTYPHVLSVPLSPSRMPRPPFSAPPWTSCAPGVSTSTCWAPWWKASSRPYRCRGRRGQKAAQPLRKVLRLTGMVLQWVDYTMS